MYVSRAVRSIAADPVEGETVTLLVEVADDADDAAAGEALADVGTVESERAFETFEVTVAHERVEEVWSLTGVATVETAATLAIDADGAGEDVRPE